MSHLFRLAKKLDLLFDRGVELEARRGGQSEVAVTLKWQRSARSPEHDFVCAVAPTFDEALARAVQLYDES